MTFEKISVNISDDKLAAIDLLIEEGLVANRSAFINDAVSQLIDKNRTLIDGILARQNEVPQPDQWFIGLRSLSREELLRYRDNGLQLSMKGFGSLYVDADVESELLRDTVGNISKKIRVHANAAQTEALKDRIG